MDKADWLKLWPSLSDEDRDKLEYAAWERQARVGGLGWLCDQFPCRRPAFYITTMYTNQITAKCLEHGPGRVSRHYE